MNPSPSLCCVFGLEMFRVEVVLAKYILESGRSAIETRLGPYQSYIIALGLSLLR